MNPLIIIRRSTGEDQGLIWRLAALDDRRAPRGDVLVAELDGATVAAVSLDDLHAVADPFRPTAEVVALLRLRAQQMARAASLSPGRELPAGCSDLAAAR